MPPILRLFLTPEIQRSLTRSALVLLSLCAIWIGLNAGNLRDLYSAMRVRRSEEHQLRATQKKADQLRQDLLKSSDFESEKRIRCSLRMLKPDEKVIYIESNKPE